MTLGIIVNSPSALLLYLQSGLVDRAHDEENIETLLVHFNGLKDRREKDEARSLVQERGTATQKERVAKMT